MPQTLTAAKFLNAPGVLLDVRSPAEYTQGHIPGAVSFPLFSDAERAQVGTCYKQQGREVAIELGLQLVGNKLAPFVSQAKILAPDRILRIYCWRGGMRSGSMAWLMETAGFQVALLDRGYKGFRHWVRSVLASPKPILTLGGMTGTGKTAILKNLADQGEQVLDLEQLANHRGSSYGNLGLPPQPSTEQFENLIALMWSAFAVDRPVWIEAESRRVGTCRIPDELFLQMLAAPVLQIERSRSERIALLLKVYGAADRQHLIAATERIRKRLGGQHTQAAIEFIRQEKLEAAIDLILNYYDKTYIYDLQRRKITPHSITLSHSTEADDIKQLVKKSRDIFAAHYSSAPTIQRLQTLVDANVAHGSTSHEYSMPRSN